MALDSVYDGDMCCAVSLLFGVGFMVLVWEHDRRCKQIRERLDRAGCIRADLWSLDGPIRSFVSKALPSLLDSIPSFLCNRDRPWYPYEDCQEITWLEFQPYGALLQVKGMVANHLIHEGVYNPVTRVVDLVLLVSDRDHVIEDDSRWNKKFRMYGHLKTIRMPETELKRLPQYEARYAYRYVFEGLMYWLNQSVHGKEPMNWRLSFVGVSNDPVRLETWNFGASGCGSGGGDKKD